MAKKQENLLNLSLFEKAKQGVDRLTKGPTPESNRKIPIKKEQHRNTIITSSEHHNDVRVTPFSVNKEQYRNAIGTVSIRNSIGTVSVSLPKQQFKVYKWFDSRGYKGTFTKPLIMKETGIAYMTIRKALWRFETVGLIGVSYDRVLKEYDYELNPDINVKGPKGLHKGTGTEQEQNRIGTPPFIEEEDIYYLLLEQLPLYSHLYGIGFEESQLKQVLTSWKTIGHNSEKLPDSLERADWGIEHNAFNADNPLNYVFASLKRGPIAKPNGFKSRLEIEAEEELREAERIKNLRQQAKDLQFENMMADSECETYQKCYELLKPAQRKRKAGPMFEAAMKNAFNGLMD